MKDQAEKLRILTRNIKQEIDSEIDTAPKRKQTRIIAVTSGKGGVGKTNIALNLAISISEMGKKVILLDADMGLGNVDIIIGLIPKYNLYDVIKREKNIREIMINGPKGIQIIPGGSGIFQMADLKDRDLRMIVDELGSLDGECDYLIVDTGAGIASNVLSFALTADEIIIVTTPEPTSITDAYGIIKTASLQKARGKFHLIVNRVGSESEGDAVGKKIEYVCKRFLDIKVNILGHVMEDSKVHNAVMKQQALVLLAPSSIAAQNVRGIAYSLCGVREQPYAESIGIRDFFLRLVKSLK
ncbi:MAG: MinD/ParA family protein [Syntrophomonadaceae bacterium]|nr:MinD/ParA family protein [Syntrophomonadaceae bacterium]